VKQVRPSSGTDVYPHMPILRPHGTRFHEWRISSITFTSAQHHYGNVYMRVGVASALGNSSDCWLLGSKSSQKRAIPCLGCRWTTEKNLTPLALCTAEKSVTVQTHTHTKTNKQTITDISTPCLSTCVD